MTDRIVHGNALEELAGLDEGSAHTVVTDPPYGLAFMGRDWDDFEPREYQQWCEEWARKAKRVLKPGGHLLAFSGNRTHHRLFSGVEDAGYEIRDTITWHYGSGFPKALDVSKAIDKQNDAADERETVGKQRGNGVEPGHGNYVNNDKSNWNDDGFDVTAPATDAAKKWDGFKTALKPATEYVVMARKPLSEETVADNALKHGTGALNIDATRIGTDEDLNFSQNWGMTEAKGWNQNSVPERNGNAKQHDKGRYPSNVVFDETEAERLDSEVGDTTEHNGQSYPGQTVAATKDTYGEYKGKRTVHSFNDSGGPSRYFYTSKASKKERTMDGAIANTHPTVKPVDLMEWLVKLVTTEGQVLVDPFCGSGTTCMAAKNLNRGFIGIEQQQKWCDVSRVRCGLTPKDPAHVRADSNQTGLESYGHND
jgi:site-specific DNA-methyltransferase (adenine-specific)